jgi:Concanavalin A-like lectin/glucanases superfamily
MKTRTALMNRYAASFVVLVPIAGALGAGCNTSVADPTKGGDEAVGSAQSADVLTLPPPGDPRYDSECASAGYSEIHNAEWPAHASGLCPDVDAYTFDQAVAACDAQVMYWAYYCADFTDTDEHTWTVYLGCCAATCDDGIQNQGENGVDCGGPCATPCPPVTVSGLIGYWTLDDPAGSTSAADTSGSGDTASCGGVLDVGAGFIRYSDCPTFGGAGVFGTDAAFDGYDDFLWINDDIGGTFSVSAWINTTSFGQGGAGSMAYSGNGIVWADISGTSPDMIPLALTGDRAAFGTGEQNGGVYDTLTSSVSVNTGSWVHLVVTRDMSTGAKQMFVNGTLDGTSTGSTGMLNANPIIAFGSNPLDGRYFDGAIDDIQFYDHVLTAAEVAAIYDAHP